MKTITFYSYKGGVGRSLALSNVATRLSEYNKKVCVLDLDLEAPGLHLKFNNYRKPSISKGIVDYISEFSTKQIVPKSILEYTVTLESPIKSFGPIHLIPAGNTDDLEYWKKLSSIRWYDFFYLPESSGIKFFLDLKNKIQKEINPDILLIDARTGITDMSGVSLRLMADEIVIFGANNEENIYGSKKVIKSLLNPTNSIFGKIPKIHFFLTRVPYTDAPEDRKKEIIILNQLQNAFKSHLEVEEFDICLIHSDRRLEENERHLIGYEYEDKQASISNDYLKLFEKLTLDILDKNEVIRFKNEKQGQKEYSKAMAEIAVANKLDHLKKAIELDSSKSTYFAALGGALYELKDYVGALENFLKATELTSDPTFFGLTAQTYDILGRYEDALKYLNKTQIISPSDHRAVLLKYKIYYQNLGLPEEALQLLTDYLEKVDPYQDDVLNYRANHFRRIGNYKSAYSDIYRAIEIDPQNPTYFATLAEIYASEEKIEEFYLNFNIALSKNLNISFIRSEKDIYSKFQKEERFINLIKKYNVDIDDIFSE